MSANREHHDDTAPTGAEASVTPPPAAGGPRNAGRRRALQVGLGAAPVILTLSSKPAFAQTLDRSAIESMSTCMSLDLDCSNVDSASITRLRSYYQPTPPKQDQKDADSAATGTESSTFSLASASTTTSSSTLTPGTDVYNETYSGSLFSEIFGTTWGPATGPGKWKGDERFGDVLWMDENRDPRNFGKLLVAAYVNASRGTYTLDMTQVVKMGQMSLQGEPYYLSESSSISWNQDQVIKYLTNTIPF